jgi:hypothetical protein
MAAFLRLGDVDADKARTSPQLHFASCDVFIEGLTGISDESRPMRMPKEEREFHRKVAARSFNRTWDYLDMNKRTSEDDQEMLHLAHASRYHWGLVGTARNMAVGDWQLSRVYADLGQPQLALQFAESVLSACEGHRLTGIVHTANEAMARAYAVSEDYPKAKKYLARARRQLDRLELSDGDRRVYLAQIRQTERLIKDR